MRKAPILAILSAVLFALAACAGAQEQSVPAAPETVEGTVFNASQGQWHDDVAVALSSASDGDVLYLCKDAETAALEVGVQKLTLDLQGNTLTIDATGSGARGGQGLAHSAFALGSGDYAISNGSIVANVGANPETAQSATTPYQGIAVGESSTLTLSGMSVSVTYAGASTITPAVEVSGISSAGSVALQDGSRLSVQSACEADAFGASSVLGVQMTGMQPDCAVSVSQDSSIEASNTSQQIVEGAVGYPSAIYGTTKESNAELVEIALDGTVDWGDDLNQRFLANAMFDDVDDTDGYVYGAKVYYAPSLELENGLKLWVFSDVINVDQAGHLESIVPAHVFARSDYALPLDASGVKCGEGFCGSVEQKGAIAASTTLGHAIGVYESDGGVYSIDEGAIDVSCKQGSYRANVGSFDLADYVDIGADEAVVYPQKSTYDSVKVENSVAWKSAVAGQEPWEYADDPLPAGELFSQWDEYGSVPDDGQDDEETTIGLSLTYYRMGADGYLYTGEEAGTYVYSPGLDLVSVADERMKPGDTVEIGGMQSTFLGWSPRSSDKEPLYTDHIYVAAENWGSFGAKLTLYGIYETAQPTMPAQEAPVLPASAASTEQLPAGGLETVSEQDGGIVRLGGIALLVAFALVIGAACGAWFARGRALVAAEADAQDEAFDGEHRGAPSAQQRQKGGLFF